MGNTGFDWALPRIICVSPIRGGQRGGARVPRNWGRIGVALAGLVFLLGVSCFDARAQTATRALTTATLTWPTAPLAAGQLPSGIVSLPHTWVAGPDALQPTGAWTASYRLTFDDPGAALPGLYLERACSNLQIWVNGNLLESDEGHAAKQFPQRCYYPNLTAIPRSLLRPLGNEMTIQLVGYPLHQVAQRPYQGGLSVVHIGDLAVLRESYDGRYFANITVPQISGAIMALLGGFILVLAWIRPKERYLLFYGLTLLGWAAISTRFYISDYRLASFALPHFELAMATATVLCLVFFWGTQFFLHFAGLQLRWLGPVFLSQCALVPVLIFFAGPQRLFSVITLIYSAVVLQFVLVCAWAGVKAWRRLRREFLILGPIVLVSTLLILTQIAQQHGLMDVPKVHLSHFSMPLTFVAIGVRLVQQFMQALAASEQSNVLLAQRVAEKTREIEHSYAQISELRANQAAEAERQRIASDLHDDLGAKLLTIAQTSQSGDDDGKPNPSGSRTAQLARQALDEMRLSVRGLTASPMRASDLFADWRGETLQRLELAHIRGHWQHEAPPDNLLLHARLQVQLTRVLREAVSNVIRHSQATVCRIQLALEDGHLRLTVDDNGRGLAFADPNNAELKAGAPGSVAGSGHGLVNIERRAFNLGGSHQFGQSDLGGASVQIRVPLEPLA